MTRQDQLYLERTIAQSKKVEKLALVWAVLEAIVSVVAPVFFFCG